MKYVIVYINDITIPGQRVYCLASRVSIFLQGNVQRVIPTSFMQVSIIGSITKYVMYFNYYFHSCGELLENVNEIDFTNIVNICS